MYIWRPYLAFRRKMFLSFVAPLFITGNLCIAFAQDIQVLADKDLPLVGMFTYWPITAFKEVFYGKKSKNLKQNILRGDVIVDLLQNGSGSGPWSGNVFRIRNWICYPDSDEGGIFPFLLISWLHSCKSANFFDVNFLTIQCIYIEREKPKNCRYRQV
jgi:hypothetical protein